MRVQVKDECDLEKICLSGQCFRPVRVGDAFRFITREHILYLQAVGEQPGSVLGESASGSAFGSDAESHTKSDTESHTESDTESTMESDAKSAVEYEASCTGEEWERVWSPYFDLARDYSAIRRRVGEDDVFMREACAYGEGLRILRQDPFETTITFIISQRKNIPAIRSAVELLSERYGRKVETDRETVHLFPEAERLASVSEEEFRDCRLGYRASYVKDAAERVKRGALSFDHLKNLSDEELIASLKEIRGVGEKVARCIALFAFGRVSVVPVDTWIQKVINHRYKGEDPFARYGDAAGIFQQYTFFYAQHGPGRKK